ncbi:SAM-dependent methyltransferase [Marinococcus luteus]|uniref:SAM-dependent methyltransferase n=1 Tax=Marinococcus luteus TaxID=1122204 RepID=UPI002ACC494D|nr:SAM-dependent methyltransferase [Marinococcus luteus]MDZ5782382.1 SAM-dependent methyltransferase [Marinococcus luteus]
MSREKKTKLDLDRIVFIGRTFDEYLDMFALSKAMIQGKRILDCPAGACSFTAVGNSLGAEVTACDIAYDHRAGDLKQKGLEDIEHAAAHITKAEDNYKWNYIRSVKDLKSRRNQALHDCSEDMYHSGGRYVPAELPVLPFEDSTFDTVLSAHFLFMYADRLSYDFHIDTLTELLRVAKEEVRIFPLVDLTGERCEHLDAVIEYLTTKGHRVEEVSVSYEFQRKANSFLRITKSSIGN